MPAVTPNGVVGSPSGSTVALGRQMLERIIGDLEALLEQAENEAWPTIPRTALQGKDESR